MFLDAWPFTGAVGIPETTSSRKPTHPLIEAVSCLQLLSWGWYFLPTSLLHLEFSFTWTCMRFVCMLSKMLWSHVCLPVVSRRLYFHIAILCLWLLQNICPFYNNLWEPRRWSIYYTLSHLGQNIPHCPYFCQVWISVLMNSYCKYKLLYGDFQNECIDGYKSKSLVVISSISI